MNVREMLEEIPKRWPSAVLREKWDSPPYEYLLVKMGNNWEVGMGYGVSHYCDTRVYGLKNPLDSTTVELAIFKPNGDWYVSENMEASKDSKGRAHGLLGWQDSEQVFRILDYISKMEGSAE